MDIKIGELARRTECQTVTCQRRLNIDPGRVANS